MEIKDKKGKKINIFEDMSKNEIGYKDLLEEKNYILIDVRSPKEHKESKIPGSINIPVLLDEERAMVGTAYTKESQEKAQLLGIESIKKRLDQIVEEVEELKGKYSKLIFLCARGGMRSGAMTAFFRHHGLDALRLKGGYKSYRDFVINHLEEAVKGVHLVILHGKTGCGKTKILEGLEKEGIQVIDLEGKAKNRGSHFGHIGIVQDQTQKNFEGLLYHRLINRKDNIFVIEGESRKIGPIHIPESFWNLMKEGTKVSVEAPVEMRLDIIMEDYTEAEELKERLLEVAEKLKRYMDGRVYRRFLENVEKKEIREAAREIMINYYDPMYNKSLTRHDYYDKLNITSVEDGIIKAKKVVEKIYKERG